jgi:DNA repair protein RecO (recombination protein O)
MSTRVNLQPGYVLHTQAYQNTSLLVDFLFADYGRVRAIAKGARRPKSRNKALLQPFQPLLVSLAGRSELKTLVSIESSIAAINLAGNRLFSGLYVNELLMRLLIFNEASPDLYRHYQGTLIELSGTTCLQTILRRFELNLLECLGYGVNLHHDCYSTEPIDDQGFYLFHPELGFERFPALSETGAYHARLFRGEEIRSLREGHLHDKAIALAARRLTRMALQIHLGDKPLVSRDLFARLPGSI